MSSPATILLLIMAGAALVVQNLLMVRITQSVSTVLITLVINSTVGLTGLAALLLARNGLSGFVEAAASLKAWALLPGLLGSFFVFAGLLGYQKIGAASTIAILVSSQLVAGLIADAAGSGAGGLKANIVPMIGAMFLVAGVILILRKGL
ncbi:DMT family transporter [Taklimakanibacter deserti]|uniref:DMT family transporter n=1 Tax=Taklimakanibacter deserti TaxID=2267839 RepID=UPI0034D6A68F